LQEITHVLPAAATYYLALHTGRIGIFRVPTDIRVHVMLEVVRPFIVEGGGPFCYVARHAIQTEIIGPVRIGTDGVKSTVFRVVTTARLEVSQ
jgi:hypothetical protein